MIVPHQRRTVLIAFTIRIDIHSTTSQKAGIFVSPSICSTYWIIPWSAAVIAVKVIRATRSSVRETGSSARSFACIIVSSSSCTANWVCWISVTIARSARSLVYNISSITSSFTWIIVGNSIGTTNRLNNLRTLFARLFAGSFIS